MDLVTGRNRFIWTLILAGICVSVILTGRGPDAQKYVHEPYIVSPERVLYGSDVNLTCHILIKLKFLKFFSFTWKKNNERGKYETRSGFGSFINSTYKCYTNTLTVKDTRMTDEGTSYTCQVKVAFRARTSSFHTDDYILGDEVPSTKTTPVREGEDVTIFLTWRATYDVIGFWSPSGDLIATIQSITVYIWPIRRSKVKVSRLFTSPYRKTVEFVIYNATKEDAGRYYLMDFKRRVLHGSQNLAIADRKSTKVITNSVPSTEAQTTSETADLVSTPSASTQDVPRNTEKVTSTHTGTATTSGVPLSADTTVNTYQNVATVVLYIITGCCVLLIVLAVVIVAVVVLIRITRQDSWYLRTRRSYITPMQSMPENMDSRGYADIDDADLPRRGAGNIVEPVGNIQSDVNTPPVCGASIIRERQQLERIRRKVDEDDEYEEVKPLNVINTEEQDTQMQQPNKKIKEDNTDEMNRTFLHTSPLSDPVIVLAHPSVHRGDSGNMAREIINLNAEARFMTQDTEDATLDTVNMQELSATTELFPEALRMTANITGVHDIAMEGRGDNAEIVALGAPSTTYNSLTPHRSGSTYMALKTLGDTADD